MRKIAIRELAFFVYQSGALTNETSLSSSAQEGTFIHQMRQSEYKKDEIKEYYINEIITYNNEELNFIGYVDGLLDHKNKLVLEEIKTTSLDVNHENFTYKNEHLAQVKLYAYFLMLQYDFKEVTINLLYINRKNYLRKNYEFELTYSEIEEFFFRTLDVYLYFFNSLLLRQINRITTTKSLNFPFSNPREGQLDMAQIIKENFDNENILYCLAPTGIGKTMSSMFGAIKSMNQVNDKLFYLTAKNSGKHNAKKALDYLIFNGLKIKAVELSSKQHMCNMGLKVCKPEECIYAKKFFDSILEATTKIIDENDVISSNTIKEYSEKYQICAFEYSLNISTNVDVIICDYNYVFDPKVKLIRFFEDNKYFPYILVDEAHNLVSRSQGMYSTTLSLFNLNILKKLLSDYDKNLSTKILKTTNYIRKKYELHLDNNNYSTEYLDYEFVDLLRSIEKDINYILENRDDINNKDMILENYFVIKDFIRISELYSLSHRFIVKFIDNNIYITLLCLNASSYLYDIYKNNTKGITYFSATLNPVDYYKEMLSCNYGDYLELKSPFDPNKFEVLITPLSTLYKDRLTTINSVVEIVKKCIEIKKGKYIVFFPSYDYLNLFLQYFSVDDYNLIIQNRDLKLTDKDIFNEFSKKENTLGLFVLGGSFSEGIDLYGDMLHGVIVVGVGLPQINYETNLSKEYFNENNLDGFKYAYTYPGFTKVVQAAGRVIRTETDKGFLLLIDNRYLYKNYKEIYPTHWKNIKVCRSNDDIENNLIDFWNNKGEQ